MKREYSVKGLSAEELRNLEDVSFKNLVKFYQYELLAIDKGKSAIKILSDSQRGALAKYGALERCEGRRKQTFRLSQGALRVLEKTRT